MSWSGVNGDQDLHNNIDYLERKLALAEKCIEEIRLHVNYGYTKGVAGDLDRYDAAKEAL